MSDAKVKFSLWDSKTLLVLLAAGQGANLVYASVVLDGHIDLINPLFWLALSKGLILGVGVAFSASYAGYQLPRVKKIVAQKVGWFALSTQVVASAVVVAFCSAQAPVDWQRWVVGAAYSIMVEASVLAVAMSSGKMFAESEAEAAQSQPKAKEKPAKANAEPIVLALEPAQPAYKCQHPGCEVTKPTQAAINAHQAKHKAKVVGYNVTMQPVVKNE